ncbi:bidirectional sugar transporter SWEET3b [Malania oleifera]|uniref:bidirectional sugar transporter SWEET3b n=1 Tax=Malania oleifera TaxID=397392 RepID=UPI0025AE5676|nr:bidirectional sugar transporter SWEET3b [Malania oleifera]XP_057950460.1 bidirectional sugar transporter SWEET3b [Malania oleifera]
MADRMRLAVGVMGNAASLLLYSSPILTFARVIRKKSTEDFSCVPYVIALLNCLVITWYALPIVSTGWENFPVASINGLGIVLELSFVVVYFWFSSSKQAKMKVAAMVLPAIFLFCATVIISVYVLHDHRHRKMFVGSLGIAAAIALYAAPLVVVKKVIRTKSVEFMPFHLSLASFLSSCLWLIYGLLSRDMFLTSPNIVGCPLGILQLLVYWKYRKADVVEEPNKWDLEKKGDNSKQLQLVISDDNAAKI